MPSISPVTKSLCELVDSLCARDVGARIVSDMDVVAILIGLTAFALLLLLIEGIDRV